jgi:hypothetical protein
MTTTPLDQVIVDQLSLLLSRITIANGFSCNAGEYVLAETTRDDIPEDAITLAIVDDSEQLEVSGQKYTRRAGVLTVRVEGMLPVSKQGPHGATYQPVRAQARHLMADIRRAVAGLALKDFPAGITDIRITGRSLPSLEDGAGFQVCSVTFDFRFTESHLPKEQAS